MCHFWPLLYSRMDQSLRNGWKITTQAFIFPSSNFVFDKVDKLKSLRTNASFKFIFFNHHLFIGLILFSWLFLVIRRTFLKVDVINNCIYRNINLAIVRRKNLLGFLLWPIPPNECVFIVCWSACINLGYLGFSKNLKTPNYFIFQSIPLARKSSNEAKPR